MFMINLRAEPKQTPTTASAKSAIRENSPRIRSSDQHSLIKLCWKAKVPIRRVQSARIALRAERNYKPSSPRTMVAYSYGMNVLNSRGLLNRDLCLRPDSNPADVRFCIKNVLIFIGGIRHRLVARVFLSAQQDVTMVRCVLSSMSENSYMIENGNEMLQECKNSASDRCRSDL